MTSETYRTVDMHTAGEPVRIIVEGYPELAGATILEKRRDAEARFDHIRRRLMLEPRGHAAMYGVIPTRPSRPEADLAVLFMHNSGYSTMCGHATLALGRWAIDEGRVPVERPVTRFTLECPCGLIAVSATVGAAGVERVSFDSVPAFVSHFDVTVGTDGFGPVLLDIAYGGAFYAILPASRLGLDLHETPVERLVAAATELTEAVRSQVTIEHPEALDLSFLYGTILTDEESPVSGRPSANLCVFAEGQVDRSPTGSGVTARMALDHARGLIDTGRRRVFTGLTGVPFSGEVVREVRVDDRPAVIVQVGGRAHYAGTAQFVVEAEDPLRDGFAPPRFLARPAP